MCGISGISGNLVNEEKFIFLSKSFLKRRGPNNFSIKKINNPSSLICHSRLSIIDLNERSNQPIKSRCGNYLLTYNGELYNFREIKRELINKGISFYTESDSEVFLLGLIHYGVKEFLFNKAEGMFAFALHDLDKNEIWLSRDNFGQKPLSFYFDDTKFLYASDSRIISKYLDINQVNLSSINGFLCLGYIPSANSFYNKITDAIPGAIYCYKNYSNSLKIYKKNQSKKKFFNNIDNSYYEFRDKLIESVEAVNEADVDVGIFLSSGLDSSLIALISKKILKKDPLCFSIGYGVRLEEGNDIKEFCKQNQLNLKIFGISKKEASKEFINYPKIYDRPMSDTSCALMSYLSKRASRFTKCVISGDGADELFWGYPIYRKYIKFNNINNFIPFKGILSELTIGSKLWKLLHTNNIESYFRYSSCCNGILTYNQANWESDINVEGDIFEYLPQNCLVKTDRASMHFGLEVRSPFLQPKMESCAKKISIKNKYLICKQKMFHRKMYRELSGNDYYLKKKKGFSFDRSFLEQEFKEKFNRSINISKKFLLNNGYDHKIIRRISENKLVKWRFFSLGLYLETLNLGID